MIQNLIREYSLIRLKEPSPEELKQLKKNVK